MNLAGLPLTSPAEQKAEDVSEAEALWLGAVRAEAAAAAKEGLRCLSLLRGRYDGSYGGGGKGEEDEDEAASLDPEYKADLLALVDSATGLLAPCTAL